MSIELYTIDDSTEWECEPIDDEATAVSMTTNRVQLIVAMHPKTPAPQLMMMLAKMSAAAWMMHESGGVLGYRKEED